MDALGYWRPRQSSADDIADALIRTLLHEVSERTSWMDEAACAETDPEAFFPEKGANSREARQVCMACPVRVACREYALDTNQRHGVWGGLNERQRQAIQRKRRRQVAA